MTLRLDGIALTRNTATAKLVAEPQARTTVRRQVSTHVAGHQTQRRLGADLPTHSLTFYLDGARSDVDVLSAVIQGILRERDVVVLEDDAGATILDGHSAVAMAPTTVPYADVESESQAIVHVSVDALHVGVPVAAGGTYRHPDDLAVEFLENDFFCSTDAAGLVGGALLGLRAQATGYAKVLDPATGKLVPLPRRWSLTAAGDGVTGTVEVYDLEGFVQGEPHSAPGGAPCTPISGVVAGGGALSASVEVQSFLTTEAGELLLTEGGEMIA